LSTADTYRVSLAATLGTDDSKRTFSIESPFLFDVDVIKDSIIEGYYIKSKLLLGVA
jgi:hypothetical protein